MPTAPSTLAKKLGLKKDMRALIVNAPHEYLDLLAPLPEGATVSAAPSGPCDFVQVFVTRQSEVQKAVSILSKHAGANALVWISYPKQTSGTKTDLNRDILREAVEALGWRSVSIISIDSVWSTLRFRPIAGPA